MVDKEVAKQQIKSLVEKLNRVRAENKVAKYNEEMTKVDFIQPLFEALGWDVKDSNEVSKEEKISKGRVDYGFRLNGIPKFFLEAKPLKADLDNPKFIEQAINYSYLKGCTWAVLTDFESVRIFNAEWKTTAPAQSHFMTIHYKEFLDRLKDLLLLSKESFEQGSLDKLAEKYGKKTKKTPVDKQLLTDFTRFRELLLQNIAKSNDDLRLTEEDLDESVQRIFDRLIFIRNAEDRELEEPVLKAALREWEGQTKTHLIVFLRKSFKKFDEIYNSNLFKEHLCDKINISDAVLEEVVAGLYQTKDGTVSYDFSAIEADVLGNIYEQYLGHILKKTEKRAKLTEAHAHRKEQGIYYTPTYIVDYIIRNTLGELLKGKKVNAEKIRVLDPACGSGSFLIKAFDVLNEHHSKKDRDYNQKTIASDGTTFSIKERIIKDNIFGVDLDKQAVEIAQLNLLLKITEKGHRLPLLQQNIKCGNSLIDDPIIAGDKAFKWQEEFKQMMSEGGFDVVIGNPPYINIKILTKSNQIDKDHFENVYTSAKGNYDIYILFIEKAIRLLNPGGRLGFIIPNKFMVTDYGKEIRKFILDTCSIERIVDVSNLPVFKGVGTYPVIMILRKENNQEVRSRTKIKVSKIGKGEDVVKLSESTLLQIDFYKNQDFVFSIFKESGAMEKLKKITTTLGEMAEINCGTTGFEYTRWGRYIQENKTNKEDCIPFLITGNIQRYAIDFNKKVRYQGKKLNKAYFIKGKDVTEGKWGLFTSKKLVIRGMALHLSAAYDDIGCGLGVSVYTVKSSKSDLFYLLGIINSPLMDYFYKNKFISKHLAGKYIGYNKGQIEQIPIKLGTESEQKQVIELVQHIITLNKKLLGFGDKNTSETARLKEEIDKTDSQINNVVYKIYGITEEEKKIIEESLK